MAEDMTKVDKWLEEQGLNEYGDSQETMYMGGSPLFNEMTGESMERIDYILDKFPNKPWDTSTES
eukprot:CAMPEP_0197241808 /NCGR_PEP_ID=MMETSP1429-20130617/7747_1 /TAXON_ID=49237 /ORGANISM="Chaetoceros  sp., Strain UNC1202" /LENGTH=64 /DNA_ID=CAMNT_0042701707 /DNA_START=167 /DNA_END=361 /DNA_ORIENTATION=+